VLARARLVIASQDAQHRAVLVGGDAGDATHRGGDRQAGLAALDLSAEFLPFAIGGDIGRKRGGDLPGLVELLMLGNDQQDIVG